LRSSIDGALQLAYQFRNRAVQVARDVAQRAPVMRLLRTNPNGLKQDGGGNVVAVGDKWDRHPSPDGLILGADAPHLPAGPGGEYESARDRQQEGEPNSQSALPRFAHNPNIASFSAMLVIAWR
jgi:hypothetical protein